MMPKSTFPRRSLERIPMNVPDVALFQRQLMAKLFQATVGDAVSLLMLSEKLRDFRIADLEWLLLPPLLERQVIFKYAQPQISRSASAGPGNRPSPKVPPVPIGMIAWGMVSSDVEEKLNAHRGTGQPCRLERADWKSGSVPRIIYAIGDKPTIDSLTAEFERKVKSEEVGRVEIASAGAEPVAEKKSEDS